MKKISVVTGSRAEYGLLKPLIEKLDKDRSVSLKLIATGSHLSKEFGLTYKEIEADGFKIDEKVKIALGSDDPSVISASMGEAVKKFSRLYQRLRPELLIVLGDRYEIMAAVIPAYMSRIPVAHIHGGEVTEGVLDEAFRHSITKMSQLHFTATKEYKRRVIQLGEAPSRVFNVGAIGLDHLNRKLLLSKKELEEALGFQFREKNILVTFHPATLESDTRRKFQALLDALASFKDIFVIFTKSNQDAGGRVINKMTAQFVRKHPGRSKLFSSLGRYKYLSCLQFVDGVVGNSSSGIIEAPSFKIGTVNIGDRQKGRIKAQSVIDCKANKNDIVKAIRKLYSKEFRHRLKTVRNPYGKGSAAEKIIRVIKKYRENGQMKKPFYDIPNWGESK